MSLWIGLRFDGRLGGIAVAQLSEQSINSHHTNDLAASRVGEIKRYPLVKRTPGQLVIYGPLLMKNPAQQFVATPIARLLGSTSNLYR